MRPLRLFPIVVLALLRLSGASAGATTLALESDGGDAWTFRKEIHGIIAEGRCDAVVVASPAGRFAAESDGTRFTATVALRGGANVLRASCRSHGRVVALSPPQRWTVRLPDIPKAEIAATFTAATIALDGSSSEMAPGRPAPIRHYLWRARPGNPAPLHATRRATPLGAKPEAGEHLVLTVPRRDGEYFVTLRVIDALGRADESTVRFRVSDGAPRAIAKDDDHPSWMADAVAYGVVPSLIGRRGLADVAGRLDAIAALGANLLWLSPITVSPAGDFGYAVTDHFHMRPALGRESDLRRLVQAAHARGMHVILDVAVNDLSDRHPYYRDFLRRGPASSYAGFFARDAAGKATHYFDWRNLENLDYANLEVRNYAIEAFARWVRDFDVDGFRVDAAWAVAERAPDFWPSWSAALRRIKPDLLLIAEASARDAYYRRSGFDAAYDWTGKLGEWAWEDAFRGADTAGRLRTALADAPAGDFSVFRFLDNNDTGPRFIMRYGAPRLRVAAAMLLTLPGLPCIYMGDEVGAAFLPYGQKQPISWSDPDGLDAYYRRLAMLRHREPALHSPALTLIPASPEEDVLAYLRPGPRGEAVLVLLNYGGHAVRARLAKSDALGAFLGSGRLVDLVSGAPASLDPEAPSVTLAPFSAKLLRPAPES